MKLLRELLLHERFGIHDELVWRQQAEREAAARQQLGTEVWVVTKQGKKYGPFANRTKALGFLENRLDIPRDSRLQEIPKGGRI